MPGRVVLKPGREKAVRLRHPWIFSGAVRGIEGVGDGEVAEVVTAKGQLVGSGYVNRHSQIVVRLLTFGEEPFTPELWETRLRRAIGARPASMSAARAVYAESDGLPGLIVDRYERYWVLQVLSLGVEREKASIVAALERVAGVIDLYERSDVDVREKEGLPLVTGVLCGTTPPETVTISEPTASGGTVDLLVDIARGHKTGAYLDQRENRARVGRYCDGAEVLNVFSYSGAFGLHALAAGAQRVTHIDSSAAALDLARKNAEHNGVEARCELVQDDAFSALRRFRDQRRSFDVIIVDPPKFVHAATQLDRATRAYKDINLVAAKLVRPGGILATFSCSGLVSAELFQKVVFGASLDARREMQLVERLGQAGDHPVLLSFPEGEYLKGMVCRVW